MTTTDFSTTTLVNSTPEKVFRAINDPRKWWAEGIIGTTDEPGEIFFHHFQDVHYCKIKVEELIPNKRVVWLVLDNYFSFIKDQSEWTGTRIIFEISSKGDQAEVKFTHEGLVPEYECYELCENEWTRYITKSLPDLITTGKGGPNEKDDKKFDQAFAKWRSHN